MNDDSLFLVVFFCTAAASGFMSSIDGHSTNAARNLTSHSCHDESVSTEWHKALIAAPRDPAIVKSYGLREGLCSMLDQGLISGEAATMLWNREQEEAAKLLRPGVPAATSQKTL
jgi:hypothetical protein